ncbi:MAG: amidase domain-containing protein [Bacillota bacterium]
MFAIQDGSYLRGKPETVASTQKQGELAMKRIFQLTLAVMLLVCSAPVAYAADATNTVVSAQSDEQAIKETIQSYFDYEYQALSKLSDSTTKVTLLSMKERCFKPQSAIIEKMSTVLEMKIAFRAAKSDDLTFDKYSFNLDYKDISVTNNTATLNFLLNEDICFNLCPTIHSKRGNIPYKVTLEKINEHWYITEFTCEDDETMKVYESLSKTLSTSSEIKEEYNKQIEKSIKEEAKTVIENANDESIPNETKATAYSYNRTNAQNYATTYAQSNNPSPWATYSADCTNFISIALYKGGIPKDRSGSSAERQWYWDSSSSRTASWTSAQYFRQYVYYNNNSTSTNYGLYATHSTESNMQLGDIIQYCGEGSGTWSVDGRRKSTHSSIVTYIVSFPRIILISQHSFYSSSYSLNYPLSSMPYTVKHYLHIVRYYK